MSFQTKSKATYNSFANRRTGGTSLSKDVHLGLQQVFLHHRIHSNQKKHWKIKIELHSFPISSLAKANVTIQGGHWQLLSSITELQKIIGSYFLYYKSTTNPSSFYPKGMEWMTLGDLCSCKQDPFTFKSLSFSEKGRGMVSSMGAPCFPFNSLPMWPSWACLSLLSVILCLLLVGEKEQLASMRKESIPSFHLLFTFPLNWQGIEAWRATDFLLW